MFKKFGLPALVLGTFISVLSPVAVLAQNHGGGGRGNSGGERRSGGGQNFSGRSNNGGGRSFNGGGRNFNGGGQNFNSGRSFGGRDFSGGRSFDRGRGFEDRGRGFDRDRGFRDRDRDFRFYGGRGYGFGYYTAPYSYGYAPGYCNPAGYYDRWGNWRYYPGCYVDPYYPY
jgi:hypothetical protein